MERIPVEIILGFYSEEFGCDAELKVSDCKKGVFNEKMEREIVQGFTHGLGRLKRITVVYEKDEVRPEVAVRIGKSRESEDKRE